MPRSDFMRSLIGRLGEEEKPLPDWVKPLPTMTGNPAAGLDAETVAAITLGKVGGMGRLAKGAWKGGAGLLRLLNLIAGGYFTGTIADDLLDATLGVSPIRSTKKLLGLGEYDPAAEVAKSTKAQADVVKQYEGREESKLLTERNIRSQYPSPESWLRNAALIRNPAFAEDFRPEPEDTLVHHVASSLGMTPQTFEEYTRPMPKTPADLLGVKD